MSRPHLPNTNGGRLAWNVPDMERVVVTIITAGFWACATIVIEALSYVHSLAPPDPDAWRFGLGIPSVILVAAIFLVGPRLSEAAFQRGVLVVWTLSLLVNQLLLIITPATFAVLIDFFLIAFGASDYFKPRVVVVQATAMTLAALTPLFLVLPGDLQDRSPAWLTVFVPTMWIVTAVVLFKRIVVNRAVDDADEQGRTDPLTGLGNLRRLREATEAANGAPLQHDGGLLLIDLDNFKSANTLHGHLGGDHALRVVADALRRVAPADHVVARIGGDEIAVFAPDASWDQLQAFAGTYRDGVRAGNAQLHLPGVRLDASVGLARRPQDGTTLADLLTAADRSMYAVKASRPQRRAAMMSQVSGSTSTAPVLAGLTTAPAPDREATAGRRWCAPSYVPLVAAFLFVACATMLIGLALPGAQKAHLDATITLCAAGIVISIGLAVLRPDARTLSRPAVDALIAAALAVLLSLTGGLDSPALPLVTLLALLLSGGTRRRSAAARLITPVLVIVSPLAYQDVFAHHGGPTTLATLAAGLAILPTLTLGLLGTEAALARLKARTRRQAATDPLTRLANRRAFNDELQRALGRGHMDGEDEFAVVMIDLDNFGEVNTDYGHQAGDVLLCDIADALRNVARDQDCVARVGGDEFAAILPGAGGLGAQALAERFVAAVTARAALSDDATRAGVSASAGYALFPAHGTTIDELIGRADEALMEVKRSGKGAARVSDVTVAT